MRHFVIDSKYNISDFFNDFHVVNSIVYKFSNLLMILTHAHNNQMK